MRDVRITISLSEREYKVLEDRMYSGRYPSMSAYMRDSLFPGGVREDTPIESEKLRLRGDGIDYVKGIIKEGPYGHIMDSQKMLNSQKTVLPSDISSYIVPEQALSILNDDSLDDREMTGSEFEYLKGEGLKYFPKSGFGDVPAHLKKFSEKTNSYHVVASYGNN